MTPATSTPSIKNEEWRIAFERLRDEAGGELADLAQVGATFPGTDLLVTYEVAVHHSELAA